jgi:hypothetical protein
MSCPNHKYDDRYKKTAELITYTDIACKVRNCTSKYADSKELPGNKEKYTDVEYMRN